MSTRLRLLKTCEGSGRSVSTSLLLQYCSASFALFWRQQTASTIASSNYRIGYCIDAATQRHVRAYVHLASSSHHRPSTATNTDIKNKESRSHNSTLIRNQPANSQKQNQTYATTPLLVTCPSHRFFDVYPCRPPQEVLTPATKPKNMLSTSVVS